ncbi:DNA translocase FtsK 4TM domain-containing protein [Prolixibacter bellariivorans]|uniref:DNA translocase FtsK 4TM domain-containing protein n=1 Tax=Prolixibacter bellariivorans TaxID=314319 RepID=UPI000470C1C4|nr:DNA translocase FtsK 4TM domain-containing protein [Prolixibacter bellariivorans]
MAKKKTSNTSRKNNQKSNFRNRLSKLSNWERVGGILSIGLFFFALYLLISLISFLLSGGADQSQLSLTAREILTNPNLKIDNVGGKWGATMADWFINRGIGLASFGVVYLLFIMAVKLGRIHKVSLSRNFGFGIFLIIWSSVALGYFMAPLYEQSYLYPGGAYGFFVSQWFNSVIGNVGTFFLLMATMLICIIIAFENAWPVMRKWMSRPKKQPATDTTLSDEEVYNTPKAPVINEKDDSFAKVVKEDDEVEVVYADDNNKEEIELELEPEFDDISPKKKAEDKKDDGPKDPELEVEKRVEETWSRPFNRMCWKTTTPPSIFPGMSSRHSIC